MKYSLFLKYRIYWNASISGCYDMAMANLMNINLATLTLLGNLSRLSSHAND